MRASRAGRPALVAVCALCPGAGASTLAQLLAMSAPPAGRALPDADQVMLLDADDRDGGLSRLVGAESPRSLNEIADAFVAGRLSPHDMYAVLDGGLRLIATAARPANAPAADGLVRIVRDAQAAHRLTVADCGTLERPPQQLVKGLATHVIWILPATHEALEHATRTLQRMPPAEAVETLVARAQPGTSAAPVPTLAALADLRSLPLVLIPALTTAQTRIETLLDDCQLELAALHARLGRRS